MRTCKSRDGPNDLEGQSRRVRAVDGSNLQGLDTLGT